MKENDFENIVVLIDAENVSANYFKKIFECIAVYGRISVRRIYADWTNNNTNNWKPLLQKYSLVPIQQFNNVKYKNVSDFTLVIDAMDLVHEEMFDCFCIVSSDSDYTRLAQRVREKGRFVIGLGEKKSAESFMNACNTFVILEDTEENKEVVESDKTKSTKKNGAKKIDEGGNEFVATALSVLGDNDGWVLLSKIVPYIHRIQPEFKLQDIGVSKLIDYFDGNKFEINKPNDPNPGPIYVRKK